MFDKRKPNLTAFLIFTVTFLVSSIAMAQESQTPLEDFQRKLEKDRAYAENFRRFHTESPIGEGLFKGPFLVYLCKKRHFACVNNESIVNCENDESMGCLIIKKFEGQKECFKNQYEAMLKMKIDSFCKSAD